MDSLRNIFPVPIILVVDGDMAALQTLKNILHQYKYEVKACDAERCRIHDLAKSKDVEFICQHVQINKEDISHKRKHEEELESVVGNAKKPRLQWGPHLTHKFEKAVDYILTVSGYQELRPKKILELMEVPGLTRDQVSSHLQKYKKRKMAEAAHDQFDHDGSSGVEEEELAALLTNFNSNPPSLDDIFS